MVNTAEGVDHIKERRQEGLQTLWENQRTERYLQDPVFLCERLKPYPTI